jgi:polyphosphate kinase 2 (PPK2 family)
MFETAELGRQISKKDFSEAEPLLHTKLLEIQWALRETEIPVIVIVSGVEGVGKGEVVNRLNKWLDTREIQTHAFWDESDEEQDRPFYWRFWRSLPARGTIGIMFGSWYTKPIIRHVFGETEELEFDLQLKRIADFERTLTEDGALIIKYWFHMSRKDQKKRLGKESKQQQKKLECFPFSKKIRQTFRYFYQHFGTCNKDDRSWRVSMAYC